MSPTGRATRGRPDRAPPRARVVASAAMDFSWTPEQLELREQARRVAADAVARFGRHNDSWING